MLLAQYKNKAVFVEALTFGNHKMNMFDDTLFISSSLHLSHALVHKGLKINKLVVHIVT